MLNMQTAILAIVLSVFLNTLAHAEMFKCSSADGKVEYRDSPCVNGTIVKRVPLAPAPTAPEVYAARQMAIKNANAVRAATALPIENLPLVGMGKIINKMKMNDVQRNESLRQGDKKK